MIRAPNMPSLEPVGPVRLLEALRAIEVARARRSLRLPTRNVEKAREAVAARVAGKLLNRETPPQLVPALMALFQEAEDKQTRGAIVDLVLRARHVSWRKLWTLWEISADFGNTVIARLAAAMATLARTSPRRASRLPPWIDHRTAEVARRELESPGAAARSHCERHGVALTQLPSALELSSTTWVGRAVLVELIADGSADWWGLCSFEAVRSWVDRMGTVEIAAAVVQRQLEEIGGQARAAEQIPRSAQYDVFVTWIRRTLGEPETRPGVWASVSARAREVYHWLVLRAEFDKIIEEFRRHADRDRANYWERRFKYVTDARFVRGKETGICLLKMGDTLIIEFGTTGNACYLYREGTVTRPLRTLPIRDGVPVADLKSKTALELGGHAYRFVRALRHGKKWHANFDDALRPHFKRRA